MICFTGFAFVAFLAQSASHTVARVPEGIELAEGSLRFAPGGARVAYVGERGERAIPVTGEELGEEYELVGPPVWDAEGEHVAFVVMERDRRGKESWSVLYDGKEIATHDWIGPVSLSPVDGTPAYWTMKGSIVNADGSRDPGPATLYVGRKKSSKWQECDLVLAPVFSPDGRFVCTTATKDQGWDAFRFEPRTGKETSFDGSHVLEVWPQPGGEEVVYTMLDVSDGWPEVDEHHKFIIYRKELGRRRQDTKWTVLGSAYDSAGGPVYSPDGRRVAFRVLRGGRLGVAVDEDKGAPCDFDWVDELQWDPDGEEPAYVAATGCTLDESRGYQVLVDMAEAEGGRWIVVSGGSRSEEFDRTKLPRWSPDGERVAFAAFDDGAWRVAVGERSSEPCDEVAYVRWTGDGKAVELGARRGRELVWDSLELERDE